MTRSKPMPQLKLENRIALVTGAAKGMGASHVRRFVQEGAKVYFSDVLSEQGGKLAAALGKNAIFLEQDVSSEDDWKQVIKAIGNEEGRLDVLVNNAGIAINQPIGTMTFDTYRKVITINQYSVFLGLTCALPLLKKSGNASVINISSIAGLRGNPGDVAYSSSKYAMRAMTQVAAKEFAPSIRVNSVHPGLVATDMTQLEEYKDLMAHIISQTPLQRMATVDDLTNMVLFLACDDSAYCTGGEFVVDGGSTVGY